MSSVQYRVVVAKKDERIDGPDDADIVVTVPVVDAAADDFDPTVAFMRGKLKASGNTGDILDLLKSGAARPPSRRSSPRCERRRPLSSGAHDGAEFPEADHDGACTVEC